MKIVITGSLGHIGKPLTQQLIKNGNRVTVISSTPERKPEIEALGAIAAIGEVQDSGFMTEALKGADAVFTMVPPNFAEEDQVAYYRTVAFSYQRAINTNHVKRVVNLSSYGAHVDSGTGFILGAHHTENILNELSVASITHIRAGYFYYNLFGFMDMIRHQGMIGSNYGGDDVMALVAPSDIASVAAEELLKPEGQQIRYVISEETTAHNIAAALGAAIGKTELPWLTFTNEQTRNALLQRFPEHVVHNFVTLGTSLHNGRLLEDYFKQGIKPTGKVTLQEFAQEFASVYKQTFPEV